MVDNMQNTQVQAARRTDVVAVASAPRPTPAPVSIPFKQVLASAGIRAAQTAMNVLPGAPLLATALRGPALGIAGGRTTTAALSSAPEGPAAAGTTGAEGASGMPGDPQSALAQAQSNEMEMLDLQMRVSAQQNHFTILSNMLKSENDTEKNAINNIK